MGGGGGGDKVTKYLVSSHLPLIYSLYSLFQITKWEGGREGGREGGGDNPHRATRQG